MTKSMTPEQQKYYDKLSPEAKAVADKILQSDNHEQMVFMAALSGLRCTADAFKAGKIDVAQLQDLNTAIVHFLWCESGHELTEKLIKNFRQNPNPDALLANLSMIHFVGSTACLEAADRFRNLMELVRPEGI